MFSYLTGWKKTTVILKPWISVRRQISLILTFTLWVPNKVVRIAGAAKANIVVLIAWCIIQIQSKRPGVGRIILITAAEKGLTSVFVSFSHLLLYI